jgi:hypothetical protein
MDKHYFECVNYNEFIKLIDSFIVIELTDIKEIKEINKINIQKLFYLIQNTNYKLDISYKNNCIWNLINCNISGRDRYLIHKDSEIFIKNNKIYIKILPQIHIDELKKMWTEYDRPTEIFERYNFILDIKLNNFYSINFILKIF